MKSASGIPKLLWQCKKQLKVLILLGIIIQQSSENSLKARFITFLMSRDNASHLHFNIWRLPRLLRFYKTKFSQSFWYSQNTMFSQSFWYSQNTMFQNAHSKIPTNKIMPLKKISWIPSAIPQVQNSTTS